MRIPSGKIPIQPLLHLWERHNEISRRLVAGERPVDIANAMNISQSRISVIMASPLFQARMAELSGKSDVVATDLSSRITKSALDGMTILEGVLNGTAKDIAPALKVKVAHDMLDRAGHGAIQKTASVTAVLTVADLEELKRRKQARQSQSSGEQALVLVAEAAGV